MARQNNDPVGLVGYGDDCVSQPEGGFETRPYESWGKDIQIIEIIEGSNRSVLKDPPVPLPFRPL